MRGRRHVHGPRAPARWRTSLRVLHVHSGNLSGGVESLLKTLALNRQLCPQMEANFALCFDGALAASLRAAGVPVFIAGGVRFSRPWTVLRARRTLAGFLRRERFDIVICHNSWSHALFAPVVRSERMPLVHCRHDASDGRHWTDRWAARTAPDRVICNSRFTAATFERVYPGVPRSILYYPASAPGTWSAEELQETRCKLNTPPQTVAIVQPSRLEPWKGHRLHLRALSLLAKVPDWVCWVAGAPQRPSEDRYWKTLHEDAERFGIADRVRFLGWVEDVPKLLAAAQVHCQPNEGPEPFGLTFVEAMGAGLPVVTTSWGAPLEIVTGDSGLLVPPGDAASLAKALESLITDSALRAKLGAGGRVRARELFDPERQIKRLAGELMAVAARGEALRS
jgi:glycosyltransferase involved in cell wall biosynthesis